MRRPPLLSLALLVALAAGPVGAQEERPEPAPAAGQMYARGLLLENGENDTERALDTYRQIVERHRRDRVFVARALYRVGVCERRLGRERAAAEAFREVVRRFEDQREIARQAEQALRELGVDERREDAPRRDRREPRLSEEARRRIEALRDRLKAEGIVGELAEMRLDLERELAHLRQHSEARLRQLREALGERDGPDAEALVSKARRGFDEVLKKAEQRLETAQQLIEMTRKLRELKDAGDKIAPDALRDAQAGVQRFHDALEVLTRAQHGAMERIERDLGRWFGPREPRRRDRREPDARRRPDRDRAPRRGDRQEAELRERLDRLAAELTDSKLPRQLVEWRVRLEEEKLRLKRHLAERLSSLERDRGEQGGERITKARTLLSRLETNLTEGLRTFETLVKRNSARREADKQGDPKVLRSLDEALEEALRKADTVRRRLDGDRQQLLDELNALIGPRHDGPRDDRGPRDDGPRDDRGPRDADRRDDPEHAARAELERLERSLREADVPAAIIALRLRLEEEQRRLESHVRRRLEALGRDRGDDPERQRRTEAARSVFDRLQAQLQTGLKLAEQLIEQHREQKGNEDEAARERVIQTLVRKAEEARGELDSARRGLLHELHRLLGPDERRDRRPAPRDARERRDDRRGPEDLQRTLQDRERQLEELMRRLEAQAKRLEELERRLKDR